MHVFTVARGNKAQTQKEEFDTYLISLPSSHPLSGTTQTFITCINSATHSTHKPARNMSQAGRPLGLSNPRRVAGVSKEAFPAELRVFSSAGPFSISLAGLQRDSGSKSTAQLVMAQQLWQGRNVTGPCCQTTANGWLKMWTRAKRGFLKHTRHHHGGGASRRAQVWIYHSGSFWMQARIERFPISIPVWLRRYI